MNRRLSMALAVYGAWSQAALLFMFEPVKRMVLGVVGPEATVQDVRLLGLSLDGFTVRGPDDVSGWLPQVLFVVLSGLLTYGVFRGAAGLVPRPRTVLALHAAVLLAAGAATMIGPALDPDVGNAFATYDEWLMYARADGVPAASAQFALCTTWLLVAVWFLVWRYRGWQPLREYLGTSEGAGDEAAPVPLLAAARERRDLVCAGLIPAVLLAVAGGPVLRHGRVRTLDQTGSVTFDPDLWNAYRPPEPVGEWSGVLYPALRLRPVATEQFGGWLATFLVCVTFLVVLAVALRSVAGRAVDVPGRRPAVLVGLVMKGWYATLLAAVAAALVDGWLLQWFAPRGLFTESAQPLGVALGDAVRFGSVWGWATGLACLGAVVLMTRRREGPVPDVDVREERMSDAG